MTTEKSREVLIRFLDGPLQGMGNIPSVTGAIDTFVFDEETYGWPLPERLCVLAHPSETPNVAIWNPEVEADLEDPLPVEIRESPNKVTYLKVTESKLKTEQIKKSDLVVRGAQYALEKKEVEI